MSLMRLWRILTILAVLFAPLGMMSGHAAMAMPRLAAAASLDHGAMTGLADHCADREEQPEPGTDSSIDCMIACSALPGVELQVADPPATHAPAPTLPLATSLRGLHPESDPPPPRIS